MPQMTYGELCKQFAKHSGHSEVHARRQLDILRGIIGSALVSGVSVILPNIIKLAPAMASARPARKALGREMPAVPARMSVKATISKPLKDAVKARWGLPK